MSHVLLASTAADWQSQNPATADRVSMFRAFDAPGLKIRELAFGAGAIMKEHRAPVTITVQVASGRVLFRVEGAQYDLTAGGLMQVDAGVMHELEAVEVSHVVLSLIG